MNMKRYFILIMLLVVSITTVSAHQSLLSEKRKVMTDVRHLHGNANTTVDRSLESYIIDVWVDLTENTVSLDLYNIGYSTIYIVDTKGMVVNETSTNTDLPISIDLSTALCNGDFYVIVYSECIYAEGFVNR